MNRMQGDKNQSGPPPVKKVEVNENHFWLRLILCVVFIAVAVLAVYFGMRACNGSDAGWQRINVADKAESGVANDFAFYYDVGADGTDPTADKKRVIALYSQLCVDAEKIFSPTAEYSGLNNLAYVNKTPNLLIEVDPVLYKAFEILAKSGDRSVLLAPVYERYDALLTCNDEGSASRFDPDNDLSVKTFIEEAMSFVSAPSSAEIVLHGDNKLTLRISDEYKRFAEENGITAYVNFYWMRNAFIADYIADALTEKGYKYGTITSYDGYTNNFYADAEEKFTLGVFHRYGDKVYSTAEMSYGGARTIVYLHDYPTNSMDPYDYFVFSDGRRFSRFVDITDGKSRTSTDTLYAYSDGKGCAETLLAVKDAYVAPILDKNVISQAAQKGIFTVCFDDTKILYNDDGAVFDKIFSYDGVKFTPEKLA